MGISLVKKFDVVVTRRNPREIDYLKDLGCEVMKDNVEAVEKSNVVLITVKKANVDEILKEIPKDRITISFVAGIKFNQLEKILKKPVKAMTMLSAEFGKGLSMYYSKLSDDENYIVERVLSCFGEVMRGDERDVDKLTAFASSLAFIPKIYEAFVYSGLRLGYSHDVSKKIALQVLEGGVEMLKSYEPNEIVDAISACAKKLEKI